ncbi:MAG: hypothetical protein EA403_15665 [Spirochaetaceae bacterium]|nr:MAG: hypothetical protein EA403_15665 [Spirochaetaceae bacterium]
MLSVGTVLLTMILGMMTSTPLIAQTIDRDPLVLVSGPRARRAAEILGPNPLTAFVGRYESSQGSALFWYLPDSIERPEGWEPVACEGADVAEHPEGAGFLFRDPAAGYAFFLMTEGVDACEVAGAFAREFSFFRTVSFGDGAPAFPALLSIP